MARRSGRADASCWTRSSVDVSLSDMHPPQWCYFLRVAPDLCANAFVTVDRQGNHVHESQPGARMRRCSYEPSTGHCRVNYSSTLPVCQWRASRRQRQRAAPMADAPEHAAGLSYRSPLTAALNSTTDIERTVAFFGACDTRPTLFLLSVALESARRFHPLAGYFVLLPEAEAGQSHDENARFGRRCSASGPMET
jgi:hypothetical protein